MSKKTLRTKRNGRKKGARAKALAFTDAPTDQAVRTAEARAKLERDHQKMREGLLVAALTGCGLPEADGVGGISDRIAAAFSLIEAEIECVISACEQGTANPEGALYGIQKRCALLSIIAPEWIAEAKQQ